MEEAELNKYNINFTVEDKVSLYKKQIVDWWAEDAHPEIGVRAEKLARELLEKEKQEKEVEHNDE